MAVDPYVNETTRHADVILPVPTAPQKGHYDLALLQLALRNVANYSPPVLPMDEGQMDEWHILARLALIAQGMGAGADPRWSTTWWSAPSTAVGDDTSPIAGREADEILAALGGRTGPERLIDLMLRTGPYGDGFGADPGACRSTSCWRTPRRRPGTAGAPAARRAAHPDRHGPGACDPAGGRRPAAVRPRRPRRGLTLVGRADLRSNNSWMHNVEVLVKGKPRCTVHVHPDDAARLGLADGADAEVSSRAGQGDDPGRGDRRHPPRGGQHLHGWGWGHDVDGVELSVARRYAG